MVHSFILYHSPHFAPFISLYSLPLALLISSWRSLLIQSRCLLRVLASNRSLRLHFTNFNWLYSQTSESLVYSALCCASIRFVSSTTVFPAVFHVGTCFSSFSAAHHDTFVDSTATAHFALFHFASIYYIKGWSSRITYTWLMSGSVWYFLSFLKYTNCRPILNVIGRPHSHYSKSIKSVSSRLKIWL